MKISRDVIGAFSEASMELLLQEPFHAHLLARLHIVYTSEIDTACVRISPSGIQLGINPDFFLNECQPRQRVALLKHELLHVIFGHLAFKVDEDFPPILANLAADIVVNQYVGRWPLPDGAIRLETFSKLKLCSHQSIDYYYQALTELFTEMSNRTIIVGGVLIPNPKRKFDPRIFPILEEIIRKHGEFSNSRWQSEYSSSLNPSETNQVFREFQDFIKKLLMDNPNLAHSLPNFVVRQLEETPRSEKKINWKVALRNFKIQSQLRRLCFTMKKPSKRYGTVPGPKIRRKCKLVVAVDTSGSISGEVLAMFSNEIQAIHRAGASVTIV